MFTIHVPLTILTSSKIKYSIGEQIRWETTQMSDIRKKGIIIFETSRRLSFSLGYEPYVSMKFDVVIKEKVEIEDIGNLKETSVLIDWRLLTIDVLVNTVISKKKRDKSCGTDTNRTTFMV